MNDKSKLGDVALWSNKSENSKAPTAKGSIIAHRDIKAGEKISVALWRNQSDNPKAPVMSGKISDPYKPDSQTDDDSDSMPF